jgi:hypothetical protein
MGVDPAWQDRAAARVEGVRGLPGVGCFDFRAGTGCDDLAVGNGERGVAHATGVGLRRAGLRATLVAHAAEFTDVGDEKVGHLRCPLA